MSKEMSKSKVITDSKFKNQNRSVLLFSGGMDSLIFNRLLNPDILLYIPTKAKYQSLETKKIYELIEKDHIDGDKLVVLDDVLNLSRFERDDMIVPCRNSLIITLASIYGEIIYLGSVEGDRSADKSPEFFDKQTILLNQMWQEQHWTEERNIKILDPYKDYTKTELVRMFLDSYEPKNLVSAIDALYTSYSCYEGYEKPCGLCKPCTRKMVALINNNTFKPQEFNARLEDSKWIPLVLEDMKEHNYRGREDGDFLDAFKKLGIFGF